MKYRKRFMIDQNFEKYMKKQFHKISLIDYIKDFFELSLKKSLKIIKKKSSNEELLLKINFQYEYLYILECGLLVQ